MSWRKVRLAVLRHDEEQEPPLVRDGSLRQPRQTTAIWRQGAPSLKSRAPRRQISHWLAAAAGLAALLAITGCSPSLETDQARLCRMALPALAEPDALLTISRQQESADGRGVQVDYVERDPGAGDAAHSARCRFRAPGRPLRSADLIDVEI